MTTAGISLLSLPILLLFSSLASLPLAKSPLPLNPAMQAVAPPDCLWFASSSGFAEANFESDNQSEQLLAEPEVRQFGNRIQEQILLAVRRNAGSEHKERVLSSELPKLFKAMLSRPFVVYVEDVQLVDEGVRIAAGLVIDAGKDRDEIQQAFDRLLELKGDDAPPIRTIESKGVTWSAARKSMDKPEVRWGWRDNYFLLAFGDGTADTIVERMQGPPPGWLDNLRREHPVERESSLGYLNVAIVLDRLKPILDGENAWHVV